ncbi:arginine--tRNA ligase [Priestia koreensis]|uniref:arginine--tRNA ligase n=1 Tax=Priestia koreensis TaxID=284581 RepID=UPI0028F6EF6A|nr:arginine--tRNA ligase [Priestia koreensis]
MNVDQFAVVEYLTKSLNGTVEKEQIIKLLEIPKHASLGDYAFPCFQLAKMLRKSPALIAKELEGENEQFERIEANGPYVNFFFQREKASEQIIKTVLEEGSQYGSLHIGKNEAIVLDMSSPNIAKPFSMGHLRSTVIGNSLSNIVEKCGYQAVKINYIGDWGTQFGKLIVAYKKWGSEENVRKAPIEELFKLYVQFHDEAEKDESLNEQARETFLKLEQGDEGITALWKWFREESLSEFEKNYDLLGVAFDSYNGESYYNDKMQAVIAKLEEKELLVKSDGADVVEVDGLPPCLIRKSDGATLYATRDLTAALDRYETYHFAKALYVVGYEQSVHFTQVFNVLGQLGYEWAKELTHVPFGLILKDGKKMSTRKGKVVLLEEVLKQSIELAKQNINEKNPDLPNKEEVATQVGVGAVIFHDLKNDRKNSIEFSLDDMLRIEGETGPYVQYTHARACSLLTKAGVDLTASTEQGVEDEEGWEVAKLLSQFPSVIERSFQHYDPSQIGKYVLDLSQAFNKYYGKVKILEENEGKIARLTLVKAVTIVLKEGLRLLGVQAPEAM